jgi:3'-phosphoadenosine 5'-phosphosulfate sulfotransferase (PAPS reductase)/FAD synthetase
MPTTVNTTATLISTASLIRRPPSPATELDLHQYDAVFIRSSGGKDSQAMLTYVIAVARAQDYPRTRIVVTHADLGRVEWQGTTDLAREQAAHYGLAFVVVKRSQGDLLDHARKLGKFPSATQRFCTSDHKRAQLAKPITAAHKTWTDAGNRGTYRVLECLGMRAQESSGRAKLEAVSRSERLSTKSREVTTWLPIHAWTVEQVWETIRASGVRHHRAYDLGMPRLSCAFCIFAPRSALLLAAQHNEALLDAYVEVEQEIGRARAAAGKPAHFFKKGTSLEGVRAEARAMTAEGRKVEPITDWTM